MTHLIVRLPYRHRDSLLGKFAVPPRRGAYTGRLAFDGRFHADPKGRRVVTPDGGKSWRYATFKATPHNARYELRALMVTGTANQPEPEPHHYGPLPEDPHAAGLVFHPDAAAPTVTSHTDAYREAA